jgi:hypothetical protein
MIDDSTPNIISVDTLSVSSEMHISMVLLGLYNMSEVMVQQLNRLPILLR